MRRRLLPGGLLLAKELVPSHVFHVQSIHVDRLCCVFAHCVNAQVLDANVLHRQILVAVYLIYTVGHIALHVLHVDVAYLRTCR